MEALDQGAGYRAPRSMAATVIAPMWVVRLSPGGRTSPRPSSRLR